MQLGYGCITCLLNKESARIPEDPDETKKFLYMKAVLALFFEDDTRTAPVYQWEMDKLHRKWWGEPEDIYREAKQAHNRLLLEREAKIVKIRDEAEDPLEMALKLSRAGNYIDMATMAQIAIEELDTLLENTLVDQLEQETYTQLKKELSVASKLVFLTDNCGEVVLDKLLLETLKRQYPALKITVLVKGQPVYNDVTLEDAKQVGLTDAFEVLENGAGIAGTSLPHLSDEARALLEEADIILSKGQGNYETLSGCGLNIYYLLLCKCDSFVRRFKTKRLGSVFLRERAEI